jgi:hypothetical protein|tara:strand:- start:3087 stop:3308 length:222 start_codon:yes stop_codon:yes gene_type:complete
MLDKFRNIRKLNGLYDVAIESRSKEIRLSTAEVGLVVSDINKLLSLLISTNVNQPSNQPQLPEDDNFIDAGKF